MVNKRGIRVAIDGPGGAGKSSVAKETAQRRGLIYVDTGALYRGVGLFVARRGISADDESGIISCLPEIKIEFIADGDRGKMLLNGEDVGDAIRTPEASMYASAVSKIPAVREHLLALQREFAEKGGVVMDGRDIGTVIMPDAELKIFLTATPETRAKRRFLELREKGMDTPYEEVLADIIKRDENDSNREIAPLKPADDAVYFSNDDYDLEGSILYVLQIVDDKIAELEKAEPEVTAKVGPPKKASRFFRVIYKIFRLPLKLLYRIKVEGAENIPEGGCILASNHTAMPDVVAISVAVKRQVRYMSKAEALRVPVVGRFLRALGAYPVNRGGADVKSLKFTISLIESGQTVGIFPQGTRRPGVDPRTTEVKGGVGMIAYHTGADVLPVFLDSKKMKTKPFCRNRVIIGKVIKNSELGFVKGGGKEYDAASKFVFDRICALKYGDGEKSE